jgi:hypothetical protein
VVAGLVTLEVVKLASERVKYRRHLARKEKHQKRQEHRAQKSRVPTGARPRLSLFPSFGRRLFSRKGSEPQTESPDVDLKRTYSSRPTSLSDRLVLDREYLRRHKARLLSTFSNRFINLARPMLAAAQPQETEAFVLAGREFTPWDTIEVCIALNDTALYCCFVLR